MWTARLTLTHHLLAPLLAFAGLCSASLVHAATAQPPSAQDMISAMERANAAVVGLTAQVPEDARSAETLGRRRQGSGVVIGADGLVLTIGYLVLEADSVEIATPEGKTVPARVLAYDHARASAWYSRSRRCAASSPCRWAACKTWPWARR